MSETKRMHYVPQTYLKHFSREEVKPDGSFEYFIGALSPIEPTAAKIKEINIKNICVENDIYKLPGSSRQERMFLEDMYRKLYEDDYNDIYKKLVDSSKQSVTPEERYSIISFVVSMFYRNNIWESTHAKIMDEMYQRVFATAKEHGQDSFFMEEKEISIAGKTLEQFQKESRQQYRPVIALTQAKRIFELTRLRLINDVVTVIKLRNASLEFITSDNPVTYRRSTNERPIPFDPTNTLAIPLDSQHLLQLRPWGNQLDKYMVGRMSEIPIVARASTIINNEFQMSQSTRFILGRQDVLVNFMQQREVYNKSNGNK